MHKLMPRANIQPTDKLLKQSRPIIIINPLIIIILNRVSKSLKMKKLII